MCARVVLLFEMWFGKLVRFFLQVCLSLCLFPVVIKDQQENFTHTQKHKTHCLSSLNRGPCNFRHLCQLDNSELSYDSVHQM